MAYTDLQMRAFAQLAYQPDNMEELYDSYCARTGESKVPLTKLMSEEELKNFAEEYQININEVKSWKIAATHDRNDQNGFVACVIETAPGKAVVTFRGTEGMSGKDAFNYSDIKNDLVEADLGLLNSTCTNQQEEARKLLARSDVFAEYEDIALTGHSLGGNLAEFSTIVSGEYGLDDKITQCVSLDGPGFSDEFIAEYEDEIEKMSGRMRHLRWSFIGTLLNDLPGVEYQQAKVKPEMQNEYVAKHSTSSVEFDENGMAKVGTEDGLSKITSVISQGAEHLPAPVGNFIVTLSGDLINTATWMKEKMFDKDGKLTIAGYAVIAAFAGIVKRVGVGMTVGLLITVVAVVVVVLAAIYLYEIVYDLITEMVNVFCETLEKVYNWAKEKVAEIKKAVLDTINKAKKWYNENFNEGYKYAEQNTLIQVNTASLRSYADRLAAVQKRIKKLDRRMDDLYTKVGLDDIGKLVKADALTGHNWKITGCINYLDDTASDFEKIEKKIAAQF